MSALCGFGRAERLIVRDVPPAIVSQWDWDNLRYDYWRVPGTVSLGGWGRLAGLGAESSGTQDGGGRVGIDIEAALPTLPAGAVRIGSGAAAVGRIVRPSRRPRYEMQASAVGALPLPAYVPPDVRAVAASSELQALRERVGQHTVGAFVLGMTVGYIVPKVKWVALGTAAIATLLAGFSAGREAK